MLTSTLHLIEEPLSTSHKDLTRFSQTLQDDFLVKVLLECILSAQEHALDLIAGARRIEEAES